MSKGRKHILPSQDLELPQTLHIDRHRLEEVQVPIVTVSASFKGDMEEELTEQAKTHDVVFSRAHYSMAVAILIEAQREKLSTWIVDPTNYMSVHDAKKIEFIEKVGKIAARFPIVKKAKDFLDNLVRSKSPFQSSILEPLKYVTERAKVPIISLHYEAGNLLASWGRRVLQVVTDPHVREHYLYEAQRKNITFAVFDKPTQASFIHLAHEKKIDISEDRVIVTGPPVDPRIVEARVKKSPGNFKKRALRLVVATSGLGTNKGEIEELLKSVIPLIKEKKLELILYASTHPDFRDMYNSVEALGVGVGEEGSNEPVRVIYDSSIVTANRKLVEHAFAWADGFVTKPSGDMAYDAVAAGCFLLTLSPWGIWEENIERIFSGLSISRRADPPNFHEQLIKLKQSGWIEKAIGKALGIDELYLKGAQRIVDLQQKLWHKYSQNKELSS